MAPKRKAAEADQAKQDQASWASYTVAQLKAELTTRGLLLTGKKGDLVARLEADDISELAEIASLQQANEEEVDWKSYTVPELKNELKTRGLLSTGKKADLVARLEAHDNSEAVDTAPPPKRVKRASAVPPANSHGKVAAAAEAPIPKAKPKKKAPGNDLEFDGPLAADIIVHKHMNAETGERRQRAFVPAPDDKFKATSWRIRNERMFMLDRQMGQDRKGNVCQKFDIAGSTGNIYNVTIGRGPNCTCMDAVGNSWAPFDHLLIINQRIRGQKCKHINCKSFHYCPIRFDSTLILDQMHSSSSSRLQSTFNTSSPFCLMNSTASLPMLPSPALLNLNMTTMGPTNLSTMVLANQLKANALSASLTWSLERSWSGARLLVVRTSIRCASSSGKPANVVVASLAYTVAPSGKKPVRRSLLLVVSPASKTLLLRLAPTRTSAIIQCISSKRGSSAMSSLFLLSSSDLLEYHRSVEYSFRMNDWDDGVRIGCYLFAYECCFFLLQLYYLVLVTALRDYYDMRIEALHSVFK